MPYKLEGKRAKAIRTIYVTCLLAGTYSHASILVRHGWRWDYGGKSFGTVLFWSTLTFVDPLVAVLLFAAPRLGIASLVLLMLSDVVHNTWIISTYGGVVWMVADQWAFFLFVLATAGIFWKAARQRIPS